MCPIIILSNKFDLERKTGTRNVKSKLPTGLTQEIPYFILRKNYLLNSFQCIFAMIMLKIMLEKRISRSNERQHAKKLFLYNLI